MTSTKSEMSDLSNNSDVKQSKLAQDFIVDFVSKKDDLTNRIQNITASNNMQEKFSEFSKEIQRLSKSLHSSTAFLPSYSVKKRQEEIRHLEKQLKDKEDVLIPKRKFGFKSKFKNDTSSLKDSIKTVDEKSAVLENTENAINSDPVKLDSNFVTVEDIQEKVIFYEEAELNGCDVLVRNLQGVTLHLRGTPSTLRISGLKDCKLVCGPVHTSIFVESCSDCKFYLCCQQLRTHTSHHVDIYLKVRARAIIEDCTDIRFAPYSYQHNKIKEWHQRVNLDPDLERFDCVDDFNWLSNTKSPNWSIIPQDEREDFPL